MFKMQCSFQFKNLITWIQEVDLAEVKLKSKYELTTSCSTEVTEKRQLKIFSSSACFEITNVEYARNI